MKTELEIAQEREHPYEDIGDRTLDIVWAAGQIGLAITFFFVLVAVFWK